MVADGPQKKRIQANVKLPLLNWVPVQQSQIKDTVFAQIDDEIVHDLVDFSAFEQTFKLALAGKSFKGGSPTSPDGEALPQTLRRPTDGQTIGRAKGPISVLDMSRARNLGIATRRIGLDADQARTPFRACSTCVVENVGKCATVLTFSPHTLTPRSRVACLGCGCSRSTRF
jgi:hypothetical protein